MSDAWFDSVRPEVTGVSVRQAVPEDVHALADLLAEMDRFYGADSLDPIDQRHDQIRAALFSPVPAGQALLAWDGPELVGMAAYSFLWPAVGLTRSLFLKELYVTETRQRRGVGRLLMGHLFDVAAQHGCSRVEWMADRPNAAAQAFYDRLGVEPNSSKVFYRVEDPGSQQV